MAKQLTKEAINKVLTDRALYKIVGDLLDVQPGSVAIIVGRNARTVNEHDIVKAIATYMDKLPEEIQEPRPDKARKRKTAA